MKKFILSTLVIAALCFSSQAQQVSDLVTTSTELQKDTVKKSSDQDTTVVRIGKKDVKVIDHEGGTEIIWGKGKHGKDKSNRFDGHWEGIEFGFNSFAKPDYSMYPAVNKDFMALNQGKSIEFNLNFYELNIGLAKNYVGLVSGMGLSFNNYRFENNYTLYNGNDRTGPLALANNATKTKLAVSYLNVPLLLEFQIPVNNHEGRLFVNAGIVGGVKIGSHTKVKYGNDKEKDRSGFNINSFNYAATARVGYKDIALFAKYSLTPLFESGKGPGLTPFTIGISFTD